MLTQPSAVQAVAPMQSISLSGRSSPPPKAVFTEASPPGTNGQRILAVSDFTQTDPAWINAPYPFGRPGNTVGRIGCTVTTIANAFNSVALQLGLPLRVTPLDVCNGTENFRALRRQVQTIDLLNTSGKPVPLGDTGSARVLIDFDVNKQIVETAASKPTLDRIREAIRSGHPVLVGIEPNGKGRRHTVLAYGVDAKGNILVIDPDPHGKNPSKTTLSAVMQEWRATKLDMVVQINPKSK